MLYQKVTNEVIINHLDALVQEWKGQFDNPPEESPVNFTISDSGMLCVNGIILFNAHKVDLSSLAFEVEAFYISSCDGEEYELGLNWRVTGLPYLAFVSKTTMLYAAP